MSIDPPGLVNTLKHAVASPMGDVSQRVADAPGPM